MTGDKIKGASKEQCFLAFSQRVVSLNVLFAACGQQVLGFLRSEVVLGVKDVSVPTFCAVTELPRSCHCYPCLRDGELKYREPSITGSL